MKIKELTPNPNNPRKITDSKLEQLKKALIEFGDLSGIVYNVKSKQLVGGHQRSKLFETDSDITITKQYAKPTKTGTVAEGFCVMNGERYSYRAVSWPKHKEMAANIAANKGAGMWDMPELAVWMKELSNFDIDFDMNLTMFDDDELLQFSNKEKEITNTSNEMDLDGFSHLRHECPKCGFTFGAASKDT